MYHLRPWIIYVLDSALRDPDSRTRIERILKALGKEESDVAVFTREQAHDVARKIASWPGGSGRSDICPQHERALIFTRIVIDQNADDDPMLANRPEDVSEGILKAALGNLQLIRDTHPPAYDEAEDVVCWNTQDFGLMLGCPHGCHYCGMGKDSTFIAIGANVQEYVDKVVGPVIEKHPGQKCFRLLGWAADIITFEPEYGAFEAFLAKLSEYEDRYGYFHTAGDNVDWVRSVPHRDRLIGVWSLTCDSAAALIEPGSPSVVARIEAARRCLEWGVPVRFKFKPMIPVRNWREEYARAIEMVFARTRPESVGFCVLMWMSFDELEKKIDLNLLDPEYVAAARQAAGALREVRTGPFPHHVRAEIYRFLIEEARKYDKRIPLYISTESREMWDELSDQLGQNPRTFICGCNPIEAPGPRMIPSEHLCVSTYVDGGSMPQS